MRSPNPQPKILLLASLLVSLLMAGCGETTESSVAGASNDASTQATLEAATDECFDGCMERFGDEADAAECAEICASIGGDDCQASCEERGGDPDACASRCSEERERGDWSAQCYEGCLERGLDEQTCREACSERDEHGECVEREREDEGDERTEGERETCEEGEELSRGDATYICQDGEWVEVT